MALVNLVLSIFLCRLYGAVGAAIGTAISLVLANGFIMNIYYHKACNLDILAFWKSILRLSLGLIIPIACGVLIIMFIDLYSIWKLFLFIVLYTLVYCGSMWFIGMNQYEKELVRKPIRKIFKALWKKTDKKENSGEITR